MGNTEIIKLEDKEFKVFKRIPVPIARKLQILFIEMASNYDGDLGDFESGKVSAKDAKNIDFKILHEAYDLLLTNTVLSPKITKDDINNIEHEGQSYFQDLSELLLKKYQVEKKATKKKSINSPN